MQLSFRAEEGSGAKAEWLSTLLTRPSSQECLYAPSQGTQGTIRLIKARIAAARSRLGAVLGRATDSNSTQAIPRRSNKKSSNIRSPLRACTDSPGQHNGTQPHTLRQYT